MGVCSEACSCPPGSQCQLPTALKKTITGEVKGKGKVLIADQDIQKGEIIMEFVGEIVAPELMRLDRCTKYRTTVYDDYLTLEEIEQLSEIVEFDLAPAFRVKKKLPLYKSELEGKDQSKENLRIAQEEWKKERLEVEDEIQKFYEMPRYMQIVEEGSLFPRTKETYLQYIHDAKKELHEAHRGIVQSAGRIYEVLRL